MTGVDRAHYVLDKSTAYQDSPQCVRVQLPLPRTLIYSRSPPQADRTRSDDIRAAHGAQHTARDERLTPS